MSAKILRFAPRPRREADPPAKAAEVIRLPRPPKINPRGRFPYNWPKVNPK